MPQYTPFVIQQILLNQQGSTKMPTELYHVILSACSKDVQHQNE